MITKNFRIASGLATVTLFLIACGGQTETETNAAPEAPTTNNQPKPVGKFTHVDLTYPIDQNMVTTGQKIYDVKCSSCHKLTDERLVGPGFKDVTKRRTPEWIMNFVTDPETMLQADPEAKAMLEICLVRMPNQNLSDEEARASLEFMRFNDGEK